MKAKEEIVQRCETDTEMLQTVVACKLYIRTLLSMEDSLLRPHNIVTAGEKGRGFGDLSSIYYISDTSSEAIDEAILSYTIGQCVLVLVEGLGPAGMLAVRQAFEAAWWGSRICEAFHERVPFRYAATDAAGARLNACLDHLPAGTVPTQPNGPCSAGLCKKSRLGRDAGWMFTGLGTKARVWEQL